MTDKVVTPSAPATPAAQPQAKPAAAAAPPPVKPINMTTGSPSATPAKPPAPASDAPKKADAPAAEPDAGAAPKPEGRQSDRWTKLVEREKTIEAREKAIAEKEKGESALATAKEIAKTDPVKALETLGISFQQLADHIINSGTPKEKSETEKLVETVAQLQKQLEETNETIEQKEVKAEQEYIDKRIDFYKGETKKLVESEPEKYELILAHDALETVFDVVITKYNKDGTILTPAQAADMVESFLERKVEKLAGLKKVKSKILPPEPEKGKKPAGTTTLTNQGVSGSAGTVQKGGLLSKDESIKEAAKLLRFN